MLQSLHLSLGSFDSTGGVNRGEYGALLNEETMKIEKCLLSVDLADFTRG